MSKPSTSRQALVVLKLVTFALKALVMAFVVALPLLGIWAASSLAAYLNGPRWAPWLAGSLAFPVLPLLWEVFSEYRRSRNPKTKSHILTVADRLTLASPAPLQAPAPAGSPSSAPRPASARHPGRLASVPFPEASAVGLASMRAKSTRFPQPD